MRPSMRSALKWTVLAIALVALSSSAGNYSLWIKGRGAGGAPGNHFDFSYWGPGGVNAGINKRSVNWDGYGRISEQNYRIRDALDCYCTGDNWCYIAAYSAGDPMIGYALDLYGGSRRSRKNAVPNASGQCTNTDGRKQIGWNIKWVDVAAGAAGGTELADAGAWATSEPLVSDLKTSTVRAMYDHNNTRDRMFFMYAGAKGSSYSWLLPGQDDDVVAYHSSGGVSGSSGRSYCNPSDWFCDYLSLGEGPNEDGRAKWGHHSVVFRDDGENYDHYTNGNWAGIVSLMRADMELNAK
ncbi:MAG TPA: hypothetical protein VKI18_14260 [Albitalea sp.]|nr:hypothetical protein [Albitalea sp.]